jgi:S-methylmethionine-dependent homocysteine/selenocysteine methylase
MNRLRNVVTDGGLETDLIYHHGIDLPHFAAFPLVETPEGRALLSAYYDDYAAIAERAGASLMLESPTWRANSDWGALLGYSPAALARANEAAITMLAGLRDRYTVPEILICGAIGPRGDGYRPDHLEDPDAAAAYHRPQLETFASAGADLATAYTMTHVEEAIGIVRAARDTGIPVAISFTVETDGRLPSGDLLAHAITTVDQAAPPDYYLVNCAHPTHIEPALAQPGPWDRIEGLLCNASTMSHAELDEATELDAGDPRQLATAQDRLRPRLPNLSIIGGCCGTDARHVASLWHAHQPITSRQ